MTPISEENEDKPPSNNNSLIKSIFIANIAELAKSLIKNMSPQSQKEEIFEDHAYSDRFVFSDSDNRLLITPLALDKDFFQDTCKLLKFKNYFNLSPQTVDESTCKAILNDEQLLNKIITIIKANPQIKIHSYAATEEFLELINFLKKRGLSFVTPELPAKENFWTTAFFGSKAGFRQTAASLNHGFPDMPSGVICSKKSEVLNWAKYFMNEGDGFVLKANRGLSGAGLYIFRKKEHQHVNFCETVNKILDAQPYWRNETVVVEEYIEPNFKIGGGTPSVEVRVTDKGATPIYVCGMRITDQGVFEGIEIGKKAMSKKLSKQLFSCAKKYGNLLYDFGYRGFFDIDWVCEAYDKIYPLESNVRRTGGTHAYELGKRLFGNEFYKKIYLVSQIKKETTKFKNKSYGELKKQVQSHLYPIKGKTEGVVLAVINYLTHGKLGYVVIGANKERVKEIENKFLKELN